MLSLNTNAVAHHPTVAHKRTPSPRTSVRPRFRGSTSAAAIAHQLPAITPENVGARFSWLPPVSATADQPPPSSAPFFWGGGFNFSAVACPSTPQPPPENERSHTFSVWRGFNLWPPLSINCGYWWVLRAVEMNSLLPRMSKHYLNRYIHHITYVLY